MDATTIIALVLFATLIIGVFMGAFLARNDTKTPAKIAFTAALVVAGLYIAVIGLHSAFNWLVMALFENAMLS